MKIEDKIIISATVDKVFNAFTDLNNAKDVISSIKEIKVLEGPAKMQVGTKWKETRILFGKEATEVMWVTSLEQDHAYTVEAESHGMKYKTEFKFVELPHQTTEVQQIFTGEPTSTKAKLMGLMNILFQGATKKALHKDLVELKQAIEDQKQ